MSEENVEVVRGILDSWARGDFRAEKQPFDPELSFETFMPDADGVVTAHGLREVKAFSQDWLAQWRRYRIIGEEFRDVDDKVFVSVRQVGAGGQSGVEVESAGFAIWTLREGRVVRLSLHYDRTEALEAAGLSIDA
jgi:ketosteroid isomerase-like protein